MVEVVVAKVDQVAGIAATFVLKIVIIIFMSTMVIGNNIMKQHGFKETFARL